ncbi:hypothetical protein [Luteimonas saliphila]|uniref:hypothetical protein n=1 Tax=Luteimonas saliphila TaxID=2804919 RepID=UPI001EE2DD47|nr:hypothetical protein [Luteimonas saliphila]
MKRRGGTRWTVDWIREAPPEVGQVVHRMTATNACGGWWRIASVRAVRIRKPLDPGYTGRYAVAADYLGDSAPDAPADWTLYAHPRQRPWPKPPDRFSPLLEADS